MTEKKNRSMIQRRLIPTYIFLIIVAFFSVFPFYWMISAATNTTFDVANGKITFGGELLTNFQNLLANYDLWRAMGNSFLYAVVQTLLAIVICSLAGFGFELYHDKWKDRLFSVLLLAMMIPQVATMIPLFKMLSSMKLLNSVWGFILPSLSTPFLIMLFRQNSRNFPKATYAAAGVITFMNAWNSYLWPKVIMTMPEAQTMPMLIANMSGGYTTDYGMLMVGVLFCSVPTMVVFFILQKQFAEGITGAVK